MPLQLITKHTSFTESYNYINDSFKAVETVRNIQRYMPQTKDLRTISLTWQMIKLSVMNI